MNYICSNFKVYCLILTKLKVSGNNSFYAYIYAIAYLLQVCIVVALHVI